MTQSCKTKFRSSDKYYSSDKISVADPDPNFFLVQGSKVVSGQVKIKKKFLGRVRSQIIKQNMHHF